MLLLALSAAVAAQDRPSRAAVPFSTARRAGDTLHLSGQIGTVPAGLDRHGEGFDAAARSALDKIAAVLKANGADWNKVVKCTVILEDMVDWRRFNAIYLEYFKGITPLPARSAFGSDGLAMGAALEIECIAWLGN